VLLINLGINVLRYLIYLLEGSMSIDYWLMFIMDGLAVFYVLFLAFIIIYVSVTFDILWFDSYGKRWGWIRKWSKLQIGLVFSGVAIIGGLTYLVLGLKYINF